MQETGTEPHAPEVRGLKNGRNDLLFPFLEQQKGLLLLSLGVFLYQNHHRHFTSFLCFLIQDKPEVGEELPFVVQVSRNFSAGRVLHPQADPPHGHQ